MLSVMGTEIQIPPADEHSRNRRGVVNHQRRDALCASLVAKRKKKKNQKKKSSNPRFPVVQKAWESPDFLLPFGLKCGGLEVKSRQKPPCRSKGIVRGKFCQPEQGGNVSRVRKSTRGRSLEGQEVFMGGRTKAGRKWIHSQGRGAALLP